MGLLREIQIDSRVAGSGLEKPSVSSPINIKLTSNNALVVSSSGLDLASTIYGSRTFKDATYFSADVSMSGKLNLTKSSNLVVGGDITPVNIFASGNLSLGSNGNLIKVTLSAGDALGFELSVPSGVTPSVSSGGTLPAGTYTYQVTASDGVGSTIGSTPVSITTTSQGSVSLTWNYIKAAASYTVYRIAATTGVPTGYFNPTGNTTFTDNGSTVTAGSPPASTSAYSIIIDSLQGSRLTGGQLTVGSSKAQDPLKVVGQSSTNLLDVYTLSPSGFATQVWTAAKGLSNTNSAQAVVYPTDDPTHPGQVQFGVSSTITSLRLVTGSGGNIVLTGGNTGISQTSPQSTLHVGGSVSFNTLYVNSNYTLTSNDHVVFVDCTSNSVNINLPPASSNTVGREILLIRVDNSSLNSLTVSTPSGSTLLGKSSIGTLSGVGTKIVIYGYNSNSWIGT